MHGDFSASESLGLITKMIHLEIKFYEDKIQKENNINAIKKTKKRSSNFKKIFITPEKLLKSKKVKLN
jgi:hypothetical protein